MQIKWTIPDFPSFHLEFSKLSHAFLVLILIFLRNTRRMQHFVPGFFKELFLYKRQLCSFLPLSPLGTAFNTKCISCVKTSPDTKKLPGIDGASNVRAWENRGLGPELVSFLFGAVFLSVETSLCISGTKGKTVVTAAAVAAFGLPSWNMDE